MELSYRQRLSKGFCVSTPGECTLILVEWYVEFSCGSISEAQLTFSLDQKWLLDQPEINGHAKLGHCIVVPVQTVKKLLVVLGQSKVSCSSTFSASINGHVVCISRCGRVHHRGFAGSRVCIPLAVKAYFIFIFQDRKRHQQFQLSMTIKYY